MSSDVRIHKDGDVIGGRYLVEGFAGEGGMQQVYRANDQTLGRIVAVKTPKVPSAERRFKKSAVLSASINHPNAAATLDYVDTPERPYLVEEFLEGWDLKKLRERLPILDPYLVAHLLHRLARGIEASHHANVIHRDLKPNNIMVSSGFSLETIKVTDFGIAKMAEEEINEAVSGGEDSMASSSTMLGALAYMAPEVVEGSKAVGKPADVWSVGAICFQLLSGLLPYGDGMRAVKRILLEEPVPFPNSLRSVRFRGLVDELLALIRQCMMKKPEDRLTATSLREACDRLCYPETKRSIGRVVNLNSGFGFIDPSGDHVFFHRESIYGAVPGVGDEVCFSRYAGSPRERAHPVVRCEPPQPTAGNVEIRA